ncbi:hypothetical protein P775_21360 [Puniceibacterium antarcticum]|uniref:Cyclic nucleotide-binding domain-containing protein n=1 Tax=Puniceibacterium antarcticum TaxID=1206336 RepID=A0A2G8R985_9RHOB|nr:inositol monophosphatase [Puniceibacterium antarcticum]PIL18120.1 hypothetical protein P775_21360 [Puniceibacterium antarcticum]
MTDHLPMTVPAAITPAQRTSLINLVRRTARTEILPRFRDLSSLQIDTKSGPQDLVTEADRASEKMIARGLIRMFPNALIIGEEDVAENPDILDKIADAPLSFTIDPVDGTWNFAHGLTLFGVILSATRFGTPVFGLLYDPITDDMIIADDTGPALQVKPRRATRTLSVSKGGAVEDLVGYLGLTHLPENRKVAVAATLPKFGRVTSMGCSCHEFRMLAQGHVDFVFSAGLTPWDHAAGALIAQRAGGHVALLDGTDYRADAPRSAYLLAASDEKTWNNIRDTFAFLLEG